jgi:alpha-glucosidase
MKTKLLLLFSIVFTAKVFAADSLSVKSPDGKIVFNLFIRNGKLSFNIFSGRNHVIRNSVIEISSDKIDVGYGLHFLKTERSITNSTYPVLGVHSTAHNYSNNLKVDLGMHRNYHLGFEIKVFNDGAAYRQVISSATQTIVPEESTVFNLPHAATVWYHDLNMHYESVHVKKRVDSIQQGEWLAPPVTFQLPSGTYACITEAALLNYPGMAFMANGRNGLQVTLANEQPTSYPYKLRYSAEDTFRLKKPAVIITPVITPWRVVLIAKDLNQLVNTDIITDLNSPPSKKDFPSGIHSTWLKPGRAVWKYLDGGGDGSVEVAKHFTDGAAALGFEHNILEGFWTKWTDAELKEVINYSKQKGVSIWLWKHSRSLRDPASRDSFFKKCSDFGVTGIKIDFFDHEAKEVIDLYDAILKETSALHLMVDFHGANKPTGLNRTYPNELTREAVKGMEASKLTDRATHETTLPFTRMIAGPMEYTVMHFGQRRKNTTWAHQVASAAIMTAPMLTYAANPDTILANPAVEIIRSIPSTWDETIVLQASSIGKCAAFARRKGNIWFVAVMNGTEPRNINIPLYFLKGSYKALIAKDGEAADKLIIEDRNYNQNDVIHLSLITGGGYIARFSKF